MQSRLHILLLSALCLLLLAGACSRRPTSAADVPRVISPSYSISVAPFTQPINASQLITGHIPEDQGRIADEQLPSLDHQFQTVLNTDTKRQYKFLNAIDLPKDLTRFHSSEQPQALRLWVAYGKKQGAQLLLVPQVLDWNEREGSTAGVTQPAHARRTGAGCPARNAPWPAGCSPSCSTPGTCISIRSAQPRCSPPSRA